MLYYLGVSYLYGKGHVGGRLCAYLLWRTCPPSASPDAAAQVAPVVGRLLLAPPSVTNCCKFCRLQEAQKLLEKLRHRDCYKLCGQVDVPSDKLEDFRRVTEQEVVDCQVG